MKKILQTGLAFGIENGSCSACNLNYSWIFGTPSNLLWVDKIVVTKSIWDIVTKETNFPIEKDEKNNVIRDYRIEKTIKLVFEILNSVNLIEILDSNQITEEDSTLIYDQITEDINLLKNNGMVKSDDGHMYSIDNYEYCMPMLWTLYASLVFSRRNNCNFSLDNSELSYLQTLLPIKLGRSVSIGEKASAISEVLELFIPEVDLWPEYLFQDLNHCNRCINISKCNDSYLGDVEKRLFNLLEQREHEEIIEFCRVLDSICDTKFKNNLEINARDLIRELNIEKVKVQRKLNKSYSNVRNWSKLIGVVSAGLSLGAIFNHPTIAAVGGIGIFASQTIEQVNDYFHKKYNWVNFVNQRIGKI